MVEQEFLDLAQGLDVTAFWEENAKCEAFTPRKPRCPLGFSPDDHWLFEFLPVPSTLRYYRDKAYRDGLHRESNRITREYVGRAFFEEDTWETSPKRIENLFGSEFAYHEGGTPWLTAVTEDPEEFARVLDGVEKTDLESWALPEAYRREWDRRAAEGKPLPSLGGGSRGPATVITSVLSAETAFFWFYDYPELMARFRDLLAEKMVELNGVLRRFSGNTAPGWWITDDNCALFNEELYRAYCFPVLRRVMDAFAPGDAWRYQHSDSAMGHLLDAQRELGIRAGNYGPTVDVALIRAKMPATMIHGQMPPFLLRNGSPAEIEARVMEDFAKDGGAGGLHVTTAGSLAAGTGVGRMRWLMQLVQTHCRYD
ncbi:MAG: uroporphyrinogen decarboxylase family protein [Chthoniobacteraceae bacterium]|nr:uroporphyrinogen decarboxylase family protein [Chthoniobacteraceae bacterium]